MNERGRIFEIHISFTLIEMILKNRESGKFTVIVVPRDLEIVHAYDNFRGWELNFKPATAIVLLAKSFEFPICSKGQMTPVYDVMCHTFLNQKDYSTAKWILWLGQTFGATRQNAN